MHICKEWVRTELTEGYSCRRRAIKPYRITNGKPLTWEQIQSQTDRAGAPSLSRRLWTDKLLAKRLCAVYSGRAESGCPTSLLGDVLEVVINIAELRGHTLDDLVQVAAIKRAIARQILRLLTRPAAIDDYRDLRPARQAKNVTPATVATHFGVPLITVSWLERGPQRDDTLANNYRQWLTAA